MAEPATKRLLRGRKLARLDAWREAQLSQARYQGGKYWEYYHLALLSDEALDRIIGSVGKVPNNRLEFKLDLFTASYTYKSQNQVVRGRFAKVLRKNAETVAKRTGQLLTALAPEFAWEPSDRQRPAKTWDLLGLYEQDEENTKWFDSLLLPALERDKGAPDPPPLDALISGLRKMKAMAEIMARADYARSKWDSPMFVFIAWNLYPIYKHHFPGALKFTSNPITDEVTGPFIEFVRTVAQEFGIEAPPSPNTIATYLTRSHKETPPWEVCGAGIYLWRRTHRHLLAS